MATFAPTDLRSRQVPPRRQTRARKEPSVENGVGDLMFARTGAPKRLHQVRHIALIGNYLPQRCGLATFTADTRTALIDHKRDLKIDGYILRDDTELEYPDEITRFIRRDHRSEYSDTAQTINRSEAELVLLQHEFGIFGGREGEYILDLIDALDIPVAVTLHTILEKPSKHQDAVIRRLTASAGLLIVMAEYGREILRRRYGVSDARIAVIPHGIPDFAYSDPDDAKAQFGLKGKKTILTFGLLSRDKGIDQMIDAMPAIIDTVPDAVYVILGATHPNLVAQEGEALRGRLQAKARELGVSDHVRWVDTFVELDELIEYIRSADVYVTPYLNPMQITSGTLSYAVGMGKPVVSTPYIHASELLVRGNGALVPFRDSKALASEVGGLLSDDERRGMMARTAYRRGRQMTWSKYAQALLVRFDALVQPNVVNPGRQMETASAA